MKQRWSFPDACNVARELCAALKPVTERLSLAGSLRRRKPTVGDIEILYIPRTEQRRLDLFASTQVNLADETIEELIRKCVLGKRLTKSGNQTWGARNKLAVHKSGIPVDLFEATAENWWNYLVCRTGPSALNIRICEAAKRRGWKWNPYGPGFSRGGPLSGEAQQHAVTSEQDVFAFVGLDYLQPWERS